MSPSTSPPEPPTAEDPRPGDRVPESPAPASPAGRPPRRRGASVDRRSFVIAGAVILGVIAVLGVVTTFTDKGPRQNTGLVLPQDSSSSAAQAAPHIIPLPNEGGRKPTQAGDPGGSLQLVLAGLLFAVVLGGAAYLWWRSRRPPRPGHRSLSDRPRTND